LLKPLIKRYNKKGEKHCYYKPAILSRSYSIGVNEKKWVQIFKWFLSIENKICEINPNEFGCFPLVYSEERSTEDKCIYSEYISYIAYYDKYRGFVSEVFQPTSIFHAKLIDLLTWWQNKPTLVFKE
jgi:hypothetical protein